MPSATEPGGHPACRGLISIAGEGGAEKATIASGFIPVDLTAIRYEKWRNFAKKLVVPIPPNDTIFQTVVERRKDIIAKDFTRGRRYV